MIFRKNGHPAHDTNRNKIAPFYKALFIKTHKKCPKLGYFTVLEHKIGCFVEISMVFHWKIRCSRFLYIYQKREGGIKRILTK